MSPAMIQRRLLLLDGYRRDLEALRGTGWRPEDHYAIERLVQLCVEAMIDAMARWLAVHGTEVPDAGAQVFDAAATAGLLPPELAGNLKDATRLRNRIVHVYGDLSWDKLVLALPCLLSDSRRFLDVMAKAVGAP